VAAPAAPASAQTWYLGGNEPRKAPVDTTLTITVHPLAKGVYAAKVRYGWVGWIEQGEGVTLVDAGMDDRAAAALEDSIHARSGSKPIRTIVFTHAHDDHVLGAKRFVAEGARLIAHANAAATIDSVLGRPHGAGVPHDSATIEVKDAYTLGEGDRAAEIIYLGHPAHTAGDLIVYLPKQRVLFAGDIVAYKSVPWMLDPGMSVDGWHACIDSIMSARFDVDSLVPGHGVIGTKQAAAGWTKRYLLDAYDKAARVASWGTSIAAYKDWGYLGAYEDTEFYQEVHFMNMRRLYNEAKGIKTPGRPRARALKY
jgi:glyoxylase-like metal-dependent hydrolase (beta-lactamase superfamily II)